MKVIRIFFIFSTLALLSNCSIRTDLFVQNFTSENILVKITYNNPIEISRYKDYTLRYENGIVKPKHFTKNKTLKSLKINQINEYFLSIEIPKNSTARIVATSNSRYYNDIKSIELNSEKLTIEDFMALTVGQQTDQIYKIE
jgi:hypothetical protein